MNVVPVGDRYAHVPAPARMASLTRLLGVMRMVCSRGTAARTIRTTGALRRTGRAGVGATPQAGTP